MKYIGPIGLNAHEQKVSYCVKEASGKLHAEGPISATRFALDRSRKTLPQPRRWKPRAP